MRAHASDARGRSLPFWKSAYVRLGHRTALNGPTKDSAVRVRKRLGTDMRRAESTYCSATTSVKAKEDII